MNYKAHGTEPTFLDMAARRKMKREIDEGDCSNGEERAQETFETELSWPFRSTVLSQTIARYKNELCGKRPDGHHKKNKNKTTVYLNGC